MKLDIKAIRERAARAKTLLVNPVLYPQTIALCDRVEELEALLREARDDLANYVSAEYPYRDEYPDQMRRWKRDMDLPNRISAALGAGDD